MRSWKHLSPLSGDISKRMKSRLRISIPWWPQRTRLLSGSSLESESTVRSLRASPVALVRLTIRQGRKDQADFENDRELDPSQGLGRRSLADLNCKRRAWRRTSRAELAELRDAHCTLNLRKRL